MKVLLVFAGIWIICSVLVYGLALRDFQRHSDSWPRMQRASYREDCGWALLISTFGPFGLIVAAITTDFYSYGLQYRQREAEADKGKAGK